MGRWAPQTLLLGVLRPPTVLASVIEKLDFLVNRQALFGETTSRKWGVRGVGNKDLATQGLYGALRSALDARA